MHPDLVEASGWCSAALALYSFYARTMIPLRVAAIAGCFFAIIFAYNRGNHPNLVASAILLPLNVVRLVQMRRLIDDAKQAQVEAGNFNWLKPFMQQVDFPAGATIFRKGDIGAEAYLVGAGDVRIPDHNAIAKEGALLGEIGLFSREHRRTASAIAVTDVRAWRVSYDDLNQLCLQNPAFCLHMSKVIVQRFEANLAA